MHHDVAQPSRTSHTPDDRVVGLVAVLSAIALAVALGCSGSGPPVTVPDGGADGGDDGPPAGDASDASRPCHGARACDGTIIRACRDDKPAEMLETCTGGATCSFGRCATAACRVAEFDKTSVIGCLFPLFQAENVASDDGLATSVLVTNAGQEVAVVALEKRNGPPVRSWERLANPIAILPGLAGRFTVNGAQVWGPGSFPSGGIRVSSTVPITVVVVHGDDRDPKKSSSSGGTMVLPIQTLGQRYRVMTYPQVSTPAVAAVGGGHGGAGRFAIVGTQPGTLLTVQLPPGAIAVAGQGNDPIDDSAPLSISLDEGEVVEVRSDREGADLSGTDIKATLPVAVFSGNITTSYGRSTEGPYTPDMAHEQMPPVRAWSKSYLAAELPPQEGVCGWWPLLEMAKPSSIWRIIAAEDDTIVSFSAPDGVTGLPPFPLTMNRNEAEELVTSGGSFEVIATKPVLVTQGIDCEPSLSLAVPIDKMLDDFPFAVLPNFEHILTVVRPPGARVVRDDVRMLDEEFRRVGAFEVAQVVLLPCPSTTLACAHRLTGQFGATLRGMDILNSFSLTATSSGGCADPSDSTCVD